MKKLFLLFILCITTIAKHKVAMQKVGIESRYNLAYTKQIF